MVVLVVLTVVAVVWACSVVPLAPPWLDGALGEVEARLSPFAGERGVAIDGSAFSTLRGEVTVSFQVGVIASEGEAVAAMLLWSGIAVLGASSYGVSRVDSDFLYFIWGYVIAYYVDVGRDIPYRGFKVLLENREFWLERYPDLKELFPNVTPTTTNLTMGQRGLSEIH